MADVKQYAYYLRGRDIAIVESQVDTVIDDGRIIVDSEYKSPKTTVTDGMFIEYVATPKSKDGSEITNESDDIDLSEYLATALVYYIKSSLAEDAGNIDMKMYHDREFKRIIERYESNRLTGPRVLSSGNHAIR